MRAVYHVTVKCSWQCCFFLQYIVWNKRKGGWVGEMLAVRIACSAKGTGGKMQRNVANYTIM